MTNTVEDAMTFEDVEQLERRLNSLRTELATERAALETASEESVQHYKSGDPDGARNAAALVAQKQASIDALNGALDGLRGELDEVRQQAAREAAPGLLEEYRSQHAALRRQQEEAQQERAELLARVREVEQHMQQHEAAMEQLGAEEHIVAHRFGLEHRLRHSARLNFNNAFRYQPDGDSCIVRTEGKTVGKEHRFKVSRRVSGEAGRILAAAGPFGQSADEARTREVQKNRDVLTRHQARRDRIDAWVREQLADGPVPVETLEQQAQESGFQLYHGAGDPVRDDLRSSTKRCGIRIVTPKDRQTEEDAPRYYAAANTWQHGPWKLYEPRQYGPIVRAPAMSALR